MLRLSVVLWLVVLVGCAKQSEPLSQRTAPADQISMKELVFLTREGCDNTPTLRANLDEALRALGRPADYAVVDLESLARTDPRTGYPTPTLLYTNRDLFGMPEPVPPFPEPT